MNRYTSLYTFVDLNNLIQRMFLDLNAHHNYVVSISLNFNEIFHSHYVLVISGILLLCNNEIAY